MFKVRTAFLGGLVIALFMAPAAYSAGEASPADKVIARPVGELGVHDIGVHELGGDCKTDAECQPANPVNCKEYKCVPYKSLINPVAGGKPITVGKCAEQDAPCNPICVFHAYTDECETDADCNKADPDKNPCTLSQCGDETYTNTCDGKTTTGTYKKCGPQLPIADKKCTHETCPTCPECQKNPTIDCDVIADPTMKSCCHAEGGMLYFVMAACAKTSDDCNIIVNIGGDVNGQLNICCNVLNNTGTITDTTITQACSNITGGGTSGGTTTGSPPTTSEGTTPASLSCAVALVGEPVDGKWSVTYTAPSSVGPVASATLTQLSGPQIRVDGGADDGGFGTEVSSPKSMATKTISDLSDPPPFDLTSPTPKSMTGNWAAPFQVKVTLSDLSGGELASATCTDSFKLEAKGAGCGCFLGASPVDFGGNAVFLITTFGGISALLLGRRRKG